MTFTPAAAATVRARLAAWLSAPEVPVKTTVLLPAGAVLPAVRVMFWGVPGVSDRVEGLAVTPVGNPVRATLTVPVKPFNAVAETWTAWPVAPDVRLSMVGEMAREKSACGGGAATTVIATVAVCVRLPEVAVKVAVDVPAAAAAEAVKVRLAAVPAVNITGDGCAVTPAGKPEIATCTEPEKPFCGDASRDTDAGDPPALRLTEEGVALNEKSAGAAAATVRLRDACVLTVCPAGVTENDTVAGPAAADAAAVTVTDTGVPEVAEMVAGLIVTPVGSPVTVTVAAEPADAAV